jgi:hypothetical protein
MIVRIFLSSNQPESACTHITKKKKEKRMNGKLLVLDGYVVLHDVDRMHNIVERRKKKR